MIKYLMCVLYMLIDRLSTVKYDMSNQTKEQEVQGFLMKILNHTGKLYTLGLLMGILTRLSKSDYNLYQELKQRSQDASKWPSARHNVTTAKLTAYRAHTQYAKSNSYLLHVHRHRDTWQLNWFDSSDRFHQ